MSECFTCRNFDTCGTINRIVKDNKTIKSIKMILGQMENECIDFKNGDRVKDGFISKKKKELTP